MVVDHCVLCMDLMVLGRWKCKIVLSKMDDLDLMKDGMEGRGRERERINRWWVCVVSVLVLFWDCGGKGSVIFGGGGDEFHVIFSHCS